MLYFDCFSGISGDMVIGALIDAGADPVYLSTELKKLQIGEEYELNWKKVNKNGITSTQFNVILKHTDEQTYLSDDISHNDKAHEHIESSGPTHHHAHNHSQRSYKDIVELIQKTKLSDNVKKLAIRIFTRIGEAEGRIHGQLLEKVHFHEVGAVDSIIDIVGTAILIEALGVNEFISSPIPVGSGHIHIDHGIYPVPAPATLDILRGIPLAKSDLKSELTTPTGAAIVVELASSYSTMPAIKVKSIGYGAGTKTFPNHPNVLRVVIGNR